MMFKQTFIHFSHFIFTTYLSWPYWLYFYCFFNFFNFDSFDHYAAFWFPLKISTKRPTLVIIINRVGHIQLLRVTVPEVTSSCNTLQYKYGNIQVDLLGNLIY